MQPDPTPQPPVAPAPVPVRRVSRRTSVIGTLVAILVVGGVGWLAWSLTHPDDTAAGGTGGARTAASGAGGAGGPGGAGGGRRAPATTVGVAVAEKADIPIVIDALGTVTPQATVRVKAQVSGVLTQVLFKEGQMVRKGDLLAQIDPRQFEMALQQAIGQRQRDDAQLESARVTLQRYQTLLQQDSIARQEVDTQAAQVKQLEGTVVIDKANEGTARLNLGYTRVVAPVAGRVGLRPVDVGNVVNTGDANGVAVITQISPIDVQFAIPQDQAPDLQQRAGSFMEVRALDRGRLAVLDTGVFASLDNQVDTQTGTVRAKARFNNSKLALFPSQFVNVQLAVRTIKDAIVVPVAALRHGNNGDFVFVLQQDRSVQQRPVKAGQATVDKIQIASGLQAGERVITEGADRLRDGSRVVLPGDAPAGGGRGAGTGGRRQGGAQGGASGAQGGGFGAQGAASGSQGRLPDPIAGASAPPMRAADTGGGALTPASGAADAQVPGAPRARRSRDGAGQGDAAAPGAPIATPPAGSAPARTGSAAAVPTPEQRQRFLAQVKDDPEQLERRKKFLAAIDAGDPAALERWQRMMERRQQGGAGGQQSAQ